MDARIVSMPAEPEFEECELRILIKSKADLVQLWLQFRLGQLTQDVAVREKSASSKIIDRMLATPRDDVRLNGVFKVLNELAVKRGLLS